MKNLMSTPLGLVLLLNLCVFTTAAKAQTADGFYKDQETFEGKAHQVRISLLETDLRKCTFLLQRIEGGGFRCEIPNPSLGPNTHAVLISKKDHAVFSVNKKNKDRIEAKVSIDKIVYEILPGKGDQNEDAYRVIDQAMSNLADDSRIFKFLVVEVPKELGK